LEDEERKKMHLAAVMANNFSNHLFAVLKQYTDQNKLNFDLLKPIIKTTVNQVMKGDPVKLQTGPAARGDVETLAKHFEMLKSEEDLNGLYAFMTNSIQNFQKG